MTISFSKKKVCSIVLSCILKSKLTIPHNKNITNERGERTFLDQNSRAVSDTDNVSNVSPLIEVNNETKTEIQCVENCFAIKGVLASSDVSASWMHPTTLYSCFTGDDWTEKENYQFKSVGKGEVSLFHQMLALISGKFLSLVSHSISCISIQPIKHLQTQGYIL